MKYFGNIYLKRYDSIYISILLKFVFNSNTWTWKGGRAGGRVYDTIPTFYAALWPETAFMKPVFKFKLAFYTWNVVIYQAKIV